MKTKTVEHMISHALSMKSLDPNAYGEIVTIWKQCAQGVKRGTWRESWSPESVRSTYYPGWSNDDFKRALTGVGEEPGKD
jgi:hypothetical protein